MTQITQEITTRLAGVRRRITAAAAAAHRDPDHIMLLAVSKAQPASSVHAAFAAGQAAFGENYLDEALGKMDSVPGAEWHFIGHVQSNKTRGIAERFDWVQSVAGARVARRLSAQRPGSLAPLSVCIQVNVSGEASKGGVEPARVAELAETVCGLPGLRLRGLMAIPAPSKDVTVQRAACARLRRLYESLLARGYALDTLSMGMTADLEAAIAEGATMVRVGTAIFGERG